jgi:DNA gyrase subunit A
VRDFDLPDHYLMMATRKGLIKKTPLEQYSRPKKGGIIAIKLREDDELVDIVVTKAGEEIVLATATGMAIRFKESDARPMGRNTSGVKGISLHGDDELVGMVVADPDAMLLTACENGYGKRTNFGYSTAPIGEVMEAGGALPEEMAGELAGEELLAEEPAAEELLAEETLAEEPAAAEADIAEADIEEEGEEGSSGSMRYRTQRRGGKGLRDIKAGERNGKVVSIVRVNEDDELLMMTARGKIQRIAAREVRLTGRNTKGVRIMSLDDDDTLAAVVRVPKEEQDEGEPTSV